MVESRVDVVIDMVWKGQSNTTQAIDLFDRLSNSLGTLKDSLEGVNGRDAATGLDKLEASAQSANQEIEALNKNAASPSLDKLEASASSASEEIKELNKNAKSAEEGVDKIGDSSEKSTSRLDAFAVMAGSIAADALMSLISSSLEAGKQMILLASDAQEAASKFDAVFGSLGGPVEENLNQFAAATGRSRFELKSFAADIGDLLQPLGFGGEALQTMSADLVKLAVDLSSFSNMSVDEALDRLNGTLIGSHENALAFGVVINENTLKAELAANGWDKLTGAALENAKVQARYNLLLEGTTAAQGDAIRTADGFANQGRALQSALVDLGTELGQELLPAATEFVKIGTQIIKDVTPYLKSEFKELGGIMGGVATIWDSFLGENKGLAQVSEQVDAIVNGSGTALEKYEQLQNALEASGSMGRINGGFIGEMTGLNEEIRQGMREVQLQIIAGSKDASEAARRLRDVGINVNLTVAREMLEETYITAGKAEESFDRFTTSMSMANDEADRSTESFDRFSGSLGESAESVDEVVRNGKQLADTLENTEKKQALAADAMERTNAVAKDKAIEELASNLEKAGASAGSMADGFVDARTALSAQLALQKQYNEAVTKVFTESSSLFDPLLEAQKELSESQGEWVQITVDNAKEISEVSSELAGDLSDDQKKAYEEILGTVGEGSAEWLAAYKALQGDLSESQRQELIARKADLEAEGPTLASVYTGDAEKAEEAQEKILAANAAIISSYRETAFEAILASNGANEATLALGVQLGILTQEEANLRLEYAQTTVALQELTANQEFLGASVNDQVEAIQLLSLGYADNAEQAFALAGQIDGTLSESLRTAGSLSDELRAKLDEVSGDYTANVAINVAGLDALREAGTMANNLANQYPGAASAFANQPVTGANLAEAIDTAAGGTVTNTYYYETNQEINVGTVDNAAGVINDLSETGGGAQ